MDTEETKSALDQDPEYFHKVNAEYEAIKRSILAKSTDYDNLQNYKLESELTSAPVGTMIGTETDKPLVELHAAVNPQLASMLSPQLTSSFYDNLNEAAAGANGAGCTSLVQPVVLMPNQPLSPPLYDNLEQLHANGAVPRSDEQHAKVFQKRESAVDDVGMTRSELDELIDKINDMQTLSRDDYPTTTSTGNLAGGCGGADTSNLSSNSSITSLNRVEEYAKAVSEKFSSQADQMTPVESETSQILNDIIQQVMTAQENVKRLEDENEPPTGDFTWESLMNSPPPPPELPELPEIIESSHLDDNAIDDQLIDKSFKDWESLVQGSQVLTPPPPPPFNVDNLKKKVLDEQSLESLIKPQGNNSSVPSKSALLFLFLFAAYF